MSEILTNTGTKLWSKDDYSELWLDVFEQITGTGGSSNFRLIDEAIGKINEDLNGYYLIYENDRLYICKENEDSSITKLPISLVDSNGNVASTVDETTIAIDENGVIHSVIDDDFSLTSGNGLKNKIITAKFDEVDGKISANTSALETLNGTGEGSVKKTAEDAAVAEVTKVIADAPESLDTLKEISDWISGHEDDAAAMNSAIKTNADNITDLQTNKANNSDLTSHTTNTDIHVTTEEKTLWNTVSDKVDKETGKGLSTNDYTTDEKTKLSGLDDTLLNKLGESTEGTLTFNGSEIKTNTEYTYINHNIPRLVPKDITSYYEDGSLWDRLNGTNGYSFLEDIFVGDYIKMSRPISAYEQTQTYQTIGSQYVTIGGINTLLGNGNVGITYNHLVMIPGQGFGGTQHFGRSRMNTTNTTVGGYVATEMHTTTIGAIATEGSTETTATINQQLYAEFGSHLKTTRELLSNEINSTGYNRFGSNTGCSNNWVWTDCQAVLMSEIEVYGSIVWSSSGFDTGTAKVQLPLFANNKYAMNNRSSYYFLKDVASASYFCICDGNGSARYHGAGGAHDYVRPRFVIAA